MTAEALTRIGILAFSLLGILTGIILLLLRPSWFNLEAIKGEKLTGISSSVSRLTLFGTVAISLLTVGSAVLSIISARQNHVEQAKEKQLIQSLNRSTVDLAATAGDVSIPVALSSDYKDGPFPRDEKRIWTRGSDGTWTESFSGGVSNYYDAEGLTAVDGCIGLLLRKRGEPAFEALIPSRGCAQFLKFRWNKGRWQTLGTAESLSRDFP